MYLHNERNKFIDLIEEVSIDIKIDQSIIEKDYYVTLILKKLSESSDDIVFKGGTSLSKAHHVIKRFSEDIDITFETKINRKRRKRLKNEVVLGISKELNIPIINFEDTRSKRDLNGYKFSYETTYEYTGTMLPIVKLETALISNSYPTETLMITNYIGDYLIRNGREDLAQEYFLNPFPMKVQTLDRTFVDKSYAICDYYVKNKTKRYSRHLYDLYKLFPLINFNNELKELFIQVRKDRETLSICPTASSEIDISKLMNEICESNYYYEDYLNSTTYIIEDNVKYEETIKVVRKISSWLKENKINYLK